jgi:dihydrofolate reductase
MHKLFIIDGTAFHTSLLAERLCPRLIFTIHLLDDLRSQSKRCIPLFGVRNNACEVDQSGRELRHRLQWIGEAEQGF